MSPRRLDPDAVPDVELGWVAARGVFRLVAPKADAVWLIQRRHPEDAASERIVAATPRRAPHLHFWEAADKAPLRYYRYRVRQGDETFDIADPRSFAVARQWAAGHPSWSVAQRSTFDWHGDARPALPLAELLLYELHIRDFTAHPSAGVRHPGTYLGAAELATDRIAGIGALRELGVNAVELMPVTAFPCIEDVAPWNPTGRNHWGYMPSFWMAASERYSVAGANPVPGQWIGVRDDGTFDDPGDELKRLIATLHRQGIAVVLDLVFNHVSIHDNNPLCRLDPGTWRVHNRDGTLRNKSGCGHDMDGRDPVIRQLMVDSASHWLREYRVDGLRLDLAEILDDRALAQVRDACRQAYSRALLIAEPWSMGGYRPERLVELGWTVWNDKFRNGFVGNNPVHGKGWIFGRCDAGVSADQLPALLAGWPRQLGGALARPEYALNYVESHDDHSSGDLARLALGYPPTGYHGRGELAPLKPDLLRRLKLAAWALLMARGPVMLAQGQDWGRPKLRPDGTLDGNSYCRDDETNWLNWTEREANRDLVEHYRRLLQIRREWLLEAFAGPGPLLVLHGNGLWSFGYTAATRRGTVAVLLSGEQEEVTWFELPGGPWWTLVGAEHVQIVPTPSGVAVRLEHCAGAVVWCG